MKRFKRVIGFIVLVLAAAVIYNLYDNNRVIVVKETIPIPGLSPSFDGFTILQISDLHGKRFGPRQQVLIDTINTLDYDMIAVTGDILENPHADMTPFLEILQGIQNKTLVFFTSGNNEPDKYDLFAGKEKEFATELENAGCRIILHPYAITRGESKLWVWGFFNLTGAEAIIRDDRQALKTNIDKQTRDDLEKQIAYYEFLYSSMAEFGPTDTLIGITHYPKSREILEKTGNGDIAPYHLVLAGHNHGGQVRIPFYGAIYLPNQLVTTEYFLDQNLVSGLNQWGHTAQYVSRGLGASASTPLLKFRLFNTPEINLITLHRKES
jgi:uncharacterized protein